MSRASAIATIVLAAAAGLLLTCTSCTIVDTGYVGVPKLFGRVQGYEIGPGAHLLNPFTSVDKVEVRTKNYTMAAKTSEGNKSGDDSVSVISADQLTVTLDCTVFYKIQSGRAPWIISNVGEDIDERIVRPQIRTALRESAAEFTAVELMSSKKDAFSAAINARLTPAFSRYGVVLESVLIRDVTLPDQITKTINNKIASEQDAEAMKFVLLKEKQEAERKRVQAQGEADYNRINQIALTPAILEARKIEAFKACAQSGNLIIVPAGNQMLMTLPSKK